MIYYFMIGSILYLGYRNKEVFEYLGRETLSWFLQRYVHENVKKIIEYKYRGQTYKLLIERQIGPLPTNLISARNDRGEDITYELKEYAGPNENFYFPIRPIDLGYDSITIETIDDEVFFDHNQFVKIN